MAVNLRASFLSMVLFTAVAAGALGYQTACGSSREPTAIFLGVSSDLVVSDDLDAVGLFVSVNGEVKHARVDAIKPGGELALPGSISILDPEDPATPVHVRVVGYKSQQVVAVRDAVSTVPPNRISVLRLPIQWLSGGTKVGGQENRSSGTTPASGNVRLKADPAPNGDHFPEFAKYFQDLKLPCPTNQTMVNGECKGLDVTARLVATRGGEHVGQVFGGASGIGQDGRPFGGACFPVARCFEKNESIALSALGADCSVLKSSVPTGRVNFGIRRSSCTKPECTIALDYTPDPEASTSPGWYEKGDRYYLPKVICDANGRRDAVTEVWVTTKCRSKVAASPTCGLWSAVAEEEGSVPAVGDYFGGGPSDAGADGDASPPTGWTVQELRKVEQDVVAPVAIALGRDRLWVAGRRGQVAGYRFADFSDASEKFATSSPDAAGSSQFPTIGAFGGLVAAALPFGDSVRFEFVRHREGSPSDLRTPINTTNLGSVVTREEEAVFSELSAGLTSVKIYPTDAQLGVYHVVSGSHAYRLSSISTIAGERLLYFPSDGVKSVPIPPPTADGSTPLTATQVANPVSGFATYSGVAVLATPNHFFWSAFDDMSPKMAIFRSQKGTLASSQPWIENITPSDGLRSGASPIVGDDTAVFYSDGHNVYGKRAEADVGVPPTLLHSEPNTESVLGLAYDAVGKRLYAVTESGRLLGGPVSLP